MLKSGKFNARRTCAPHKQRGVVLLIALIILVAMTLAGIGMMRSVDTGNIIAGNLAFRQATQHANDQGANAAFYSFILRANSGNGVNRTMLYVNGDNTHPCVAGTTVPVCAPGNNFSFTGYNSVPPATCEVDRTCTGQEYNWWKNAASWNGAPFVPVYVDPAHPNTSPVIANVYYLIHRMCTNANGPPTQHTCQWQPEFGCTATPQNPCNQAVLYRITTRAVGSRNTVTYAQTLVLNPEYVGP